MLLLLSVQYNQTFSTTPAGNIRISFTHARAIPVNIVPVPAITAGFTYFSTPFPRETRGFGPIPTPVQNSSREREDGQQSRPGAEV